MTENIAFRIMVTFLRNIFNFKDTKDFLNKKQSRFHMVKNTKQV